MRLSRSWPLVAAVLAFLSAGPASAQFMYLDTDGDGLSSPADVISPTGPTTVDVWLRTDTNADGSPASCVSADGDLTLNSYEFILHAVNGTVTWGAFTNRQPGFSTNLGLASNASDYHNGQGGGSPLPPGTYRLATVALEVLAGSPSLTIVPNTALGGAYLTAFSSNCSGNDFDNTLELGGEWSDVAGAAYGGAENRAPSLVAPSDMTVNEGAVAEQDLEASDPDGDPVTFAVASGPSYVSVTTLDPGTGLATGRVHLAPGGADAGSATAVLEASDGFATDQKSLHIEVVDVTTPTVAAIDDMTLREGESQQQLLHATDTDGDPLEFTLVSGPAYADVGTVSPQGPATGRLRVTPGFADAGVALVTVAASDGFLHGEQSAHVTVTDPYPPHNEILCRPADMVVPSGTTAQQAIHALSPDGQPITFLKDSGPAFVTVSTQSSNPADASGTITVAPGAAVVGSFPVTVAATDGIATDRQPFTVAVGDARALPDPGSLVYTGVCQEAVVGPMPQNVAAADLDGDGVLDLVTPNLYGSSLTILRGRGDGSFDRRRDYPLMVRPRFADIADFNEDGRPDIAVVDYSLNIVSIIDGTGPCEFGGRRDYQTGLGPAHVKFGDFNEDGHIDLVIGDANAATVSVLLGRGDGTFQSHVDYATGGRPCFSGSADFNGDHHLDLAVVNEEGTVSVLLGNGDGTFQPQTRYPLGSDPRECDIGDLNGDGSPDLAITNFLDATVSVLLGNPDGTFREQTTFPTGTEPWSVAIGDIDEDHRLDMAISNVVDNTISVFLGHGDGTFEPRVDHPGGLHARTVILGDANRDDRLDLIVANETASSVDVFLGDGTGNFRTGTGTSVGDGPELLVGGDWDGDGNLDVAVSTANSGNIAIRLGSPGGGFRPAADVPVAFPPGSLAAGDWDQDGHADLAVTGWGSSALVSTFHGNGDGTFQHAADLTAVSDFHRLGVADLDRDGRWDVVVSNASSRSLSVYRGETGGAFAAATTVSLAGSPSEFALGDVNGDGAPDIVVSEFNPAGVVVLLGDGTGSFTAGPAVTTPEIQNPPFLLLSDLNGDGVLDLGLTSDAFVTNDRSHDVCAVALGAGDGTFGAFATLPTDAIPIELVAVDANGDGRRDLVLRSDLGVGLSLYQGLGNGQFAPPVDFGQGRRFGAVIAGDWTGDGRKDLLFSEFDADSITLVENRGTSPVVNRAPLVDAPDTLMARAGQRVDFPVTALDPDDDPIDALVADLSELPPGSDAAFVANAGRTWGEFTWTSQESDAGTYVVRFTAINRSSGSSSTRIELAPPNRAPTAVAGGPYSGTVGVPVEFDGRQSSDPDGDALAMSWEFGDGGSGAGAVVAHAYSSEGDYTGTLTVTDGELSATDQTTASITEALAARAFTAPEDRVLRLFSARPVWCAQVEPVQGSFDIADIDYGTVTMRLRDSSGSPEIHAQLTKDRVAHDRDRNGVAEASLCFGRDDVRTLFGTVAGTRTVPVTIEGSVGAGRFEVSLNLEVKGAPGRVGVAVSPNPMNPVATMTVALSRAGRLRIAVFDASGRLVRRLLDQAHASAGYHEVRFDGQGDDGRPLASGIYFYAVETVDGVTKGKLTILR
jgi:hypothetical protein